MGLSISATSAAESDVDLADAFVVFHAGIRRALQEVGDRGAAAAPVGENAAFDQFAARSEGLQIVITVDPGHDRVVTARHDGDPSPAERAVLEELCAYAIGATPRELVEHGLSFVVERLRDPDAPRPVDGILAPRNAGPCFRKPARLVRALRDAYVSATGPFTGDNSFDRPYSEAWLAMKPAAKHKRLQALIQTYRDRAGLDETAMAVFEIDQYDRVVVMFGADMEVWDKPPHLLALERWLRRETGERIEVFVEIAKDSNRIRRL
jgi:hypothetical protein